MAWLRPLGAFDAVLAGGALALMMLIPLAEIVMRPLSGRGIENAPVLVQHLGLILAMFGALVAERPAHRRAHCRHQFSPAGRHAGASELGFRQ